MKKTFVFLAYIAFMCFNTYGQNAYKGKITTLPNPCETVPCLPGMVLGLKTTSNNYVLTINSNWIWSNKLIVEDIEYIIDDEVEITGIITTKQGVNSKEYTELGIETIRKLSATNIKSLPFDNNKVYYDVEKQVIVIDETLQNQLLALELYNTQGKVILKKNIDNPFVSIANLPPGAYLYRLYLKNREVCFGKIIK